MGAVANGRPEGAVGTYLVIAVATVLLVSAGPAWSSWGKPLVEYGQPAPDGNGQVLAAMAKGQLADGRLIVGLWFEGAVSPVDGTALPGNFGIYNLDMETGELVRELRHDYPWEQGGTPKNVDFYDEQFVGIPLILDNGDRIYKGDNKNLYRYVDGYGLRSHGSRLGSFVVGRNGNIGMASWVRDRVYRLHRGGTDQLMKDGDYIPGVTNPVTPLFRAKAVCADGSVIAVFRESVTDADRVTRVLEGVFDSQYPMYVPTYAAGHGDSSVALFYADYITQRTMNSPPYCALAYNDSIRGDHRIHQGRPSATQWYTPTFVGFADGGFVAEGSVYDSLTDTHMGTGIYLFDQDGTIVNMVIPGDDNAFGDGTVRTVGSVEVLTKCSDFAYLNVPGISFRVVLDDATSPGSSDEAWWRMNLDGSLEKAFMIGEAIPGTSATITGADFYGWTIDGKSIYTVRSSEGYNYAVCYGSVQGLTFDVNFGADLDLGYEDEIFTSMSGDRAYEIDERIIVRTNPDGSLSSAGPPSSVMENGRYELDSLRLYGFTPGGKVLGLASLDPTDPDDAEKSVYYLHDGSQAVALVDRSEPFNAKEMQWHDWAALSRGPWVYVDSADRPVFRVTYADGSGGLYVLPVTQWALTVNSGTGGGDYYPGQRVEISAEPAPSGKGFRNWVGDTSGIAGIYDDVTTLTMPESQTEVTATYAVLRCLTVNSGSGGGDWGEGRVVGISADTPATGLGFHAWVGDTAGVADISEGSTTYTIGASDAEITATYADLPRYALTVNSGSGSGTYWQGQLVGISADIAISGQEFAYWVGDVSQVADTGEANTTLTMPGGDAAVTATYRNLEYLLTVTGGSGGGLREFGEVVTIYANEENPPITVFDQWVGDTFCIADVMQTSTLLTMPASETWVTATYTVLPRLNVYSGGGGGFFPAETVVTITADAPPSGKAFGLWAGDVAYVADRAQPVTTVTMPEFDISVTATFAWGYLLTVNSGSGGGYYLSGAIVDIEALPASAGQVFDCWIGDTSGLDDAYSMVTTYEMAEADAEITAAYSDIPRHYLSVNSGSGSGTYWLGQIVSIQAEAAPAGDEFYCWAGDTEGIADTTLAETTILMPDADVEITATYGPSRHALNVTNGSGTGRYIAGSVVDISADPAPSGKAFGMWVGQITYVADRAQAQTTVTMPESDVSVTAIYAWGYALTVHSGTGDGTYLSGAVVDIQADPAPAGMQFAEWAGDVADVADVQSAGTTFTVPNADCEVTATYVAAPLRGDIDGDDFVSFSDLDILLGQWGRSGTEITDGRADLTGDGFIGQADLDIVLDNWCGTQ